MSSGLWSKPTPAGAMAPGVRSSRRPAPDRQPLPLQIELAAQLAANELGILGEKQHAFAGSEPNDLGWFHRVLVNRIDAAAILYRGCGRTVTPAATNGTAREGGPSDGRT